MAYDIPKITINVMKGFGTGLVLSTLLTVATTAPPITLTQLLLNPFVLLFSVLGLGVGFESTQNGQSSQGTQSTAQ